MSKPKRIKTIEGTKDLLGREMARFGRIQRAAERVFGLYGYAPVSTPIFEDTRLFARSIGEATDIVEKEMYTFAPGRDSLTLRPEGTAGVVRAYLQHRLDKEQSLQKLWYAGPMFRRERPQKGRQRQFHQVGVEAIGSADPLLDAETVGCALAFYRELGIDGVRTKINSIGCSEPSCRNAYREALREALAPELPNLCKNCNRRFERNILRILDCKTPACREVRERLPRIDEHLCEACREHKAVVEATLAASGAEVEIDPFIVRGLDYYSRTVFEFSHGALGAQDAIGAGGRYDGLVEELGGAPTPAVGFAIGVERVMIAMEALDCCACETPLVAFGIALGEGPRRAMTGLLARLRAAGLSAEMDYEGRSMKSQMRKANRLGALSVLILGEDELGRGEVAIKDMREGGEQRSVPLAEMISTLKTMLGVRPL